MKLNFKEDTLAKYSFKDLEYGLKLLNIKLENIEGEMMILKKYSIPDHQIEIARKEASNFIHLRVKLVENELSTRMLIGNDDGMLERELLGVKNG